MEKSAKITQNCNYDYNLQISDNEASTAAQGVANLMSHHYQVSLLFMLFYKKNLSLIIK